MVNKSIAMTIAQIEKSSNEFKTTHKIKVSGPYDDEQMPKWFKIYAEKTDKRLDKLENEMPKWFKTWAENVYEKQQPTWFKKWNEEKFEPLVKRVDRIENILERNNLH